MGSGHRGVGDVHSAHRDLAQSFHKRLRLWDLRGRGCGAAVDRTSASQHAHRLIPTIINYLMRPACGPTFPSETQRRLVGPFVPLRRTSGPTHTPAGGWWVPRPLLRHTVVPKRPRARGWWDHLFRNIINFLNNSHHNHQQSPSSSCKWPSWIEPHVITAVAGASRGVRDRGRGWFSLGSHVT